MDVKGLVRNILPFSNTGAGDVRRRERAKEATESTATETADREGNGQSQAEGDGKRRNLSDEEIQMAIKSLESLPGVKDSGLTFKLSKVDGVSVVTVEDRNGKMVRRIPESELSLALRDKDKKTGHLLNKAM